MYLFRILFNNDPQQIPFNSAEKWPRKWYRNTTLLAKKMHNGENTLEVLLYLTIGTIGGLNNTSNTQRMHFMYINGVNLEACLVLNL